MQARIDEAGSPWVRWRSQFFVTLIGEVGCPSWKVVEKHSRKLPEKNQFMTLVTLRFANPDFITK